MIYADKISFNHDDEEILETIVQINLRSDGGEDINGWYPKENINDWLHEDDLIIEVDIFPYPKLIPVDKPIKYVRSTEDDTKKDNLLNLPHCYEDNI